MDRGIRVDGSSKGYAGSILDLSTRVCHTVPQQIVKVIRAPTGRRRRQVDTKVRGSGSRSRRDVAFVLPTAPASAQYVPGQPGCIADPTEIQANVSTPGTLNCVNCVAGAQADAFVVVDGQKIPIGSATVSTDK